jgi:hypothetical protein
MELKKWQKKVSSKPTSAADKTTQAGANFSGCKEKNVKAMLG